MRESHPDEDFAETFAVWLRPRSNWRTRYAGWPALKKLEYVDELMAEIAGEPPPVMTKERVEPLSKLSQTLGEHYQKKQAFYAFTPPKTYDRDLSDAFLRRSTTSTGAAGRGFHQAAPRASQAADRAMDGREPAYARCRSR